MSDEFELPDVYPHWEVDNVVLVLPAADRTTTRVYFDMSLRQAKRLRSRLDRAILEFERLQMGVATHKEGDDE